MLMLIPSMQSYRPERHYSKIYNFVKIINVGRKTKDIHVGSPMAVRINSCCVAIFQLYARMHLPDQVTVNRRRRKREPTNNCFVLHLNFILFYCFRLRIQFSVDANIRCVVHVHVVDECEWRISFTPTTSDKRPETTKLTTDNNKTRTEENGKSLLQMDGCLLSGESSVAIHFMYLVRVGRSVGRPVGGPETQWKRRSESENEYTCVRNADAKEDDSDSSDNDVYFHRNIYRMNSDRPAHRKCAGTGKTKTTEN